MSAFGKVAAFLSLVGLISAISGEPFGWVLAIGGAVGVAIAVAAGGRA